MADETKDVWAICELMGHIRMAGRITEEEKFGSKIGRIDIPVTTTCLACAGFGTSGFMVAEPCAVCKGAKVEVNFTTQYFGGAAVYRLTIVSEEVARHVAKSCNPTPISPWEFPKAALTHEVGVNHGDDEDDGDDSDPDDDLPY